MTDYVLMPGSDYQNICNAVREKTGGTELLRSGDLAEMIAGISADSHYDAFWDAYQENGDRTNYYLRFSQDGWNGETFRPKYPIICKDGNTNARSVFSSSRITDIYVPIEVTGIPMDEMFYRCTALQTISLLTLNGVTGASNAFLACSKLENLTVAGSIDVDFNLSATAVLTDASVQSVLDHLKDLTGQTTKTLTFHNAVGSRLTDAQKAAVTARNWTLAY